MSSACTAPWIIEPVREGAEHDERRALWVLEQLAQQPLDGTSCVVVPVAQRLPRVLEVVQRVLHLRRALLWD